MPPPELKSVRYVIEQARLHPAGALPTETHQSYPVPSSVGTALKLVFFYSTSRLVPHDGLYLLAPSYRAVLDATSGAFEELRAVEPAELGVQGVAPGAVLGKYGLPAGVGPEEFLAHKERLLQRYDQLLPLFAAGETPTTRESRQAAEEFRALFALVTEGVLAPFYRATARRFFAWIDALAA